MLQLEHMVGAGGAIQKPSENLSDCGTAPYHRFFLVRDEGAIGPNPPSSTGIMLRRGDRKKPSERRGPGPGIEVASRHLSQLGRRGMKVFELGVAR